jgi:outer membrane lipoprotein-sorting protein
MKKLLALMLLTPRFALAIDQAKVDAIVKEIDERQRSSGDYKALCYIEQKEQGKSDLVYQAVIYRRDEDDKLMILFLKPKSEAGKGYLRLDKNLFMYDPTVGKWERRTDRERILGTDSRRADFDESRLSEEYVAKWIADETIKKFSVHHIQLAAKEGSDVAYPLVDLWVDTATNNILKREDRALSKKLMRTTYYPQWTKVFSESKGAEVYYPKEIHIFDEVQKENKTTIAITKLDLNPLSPNLFTKAWLESKSR